HLSQARCLSLTVHKPATAHRAAVSMKSTVWKTQVPGAIREGSPSQARSREPSTLSLTGHRPRRIRARGARTRAAGYRRDGTTPHRALVTSQWNDVWQYRWL